MTYMAKPAEVTRTWYIIDAAEKPLGRVAATAAHLLRGKHKPTFTPHMILSMIFQKHRLEI